MHFMLGSQVKRGPRFQDFHKRLSEMSVWVDEQNARRDDITRTLRKSDSSNLQEIKRDLKALELMKSDATEAISKVVIESNSPERTWATGSFHMSN